MSSEDKYCSEHGYFELETGDVCPVCGFEFAMDAVKPSRKCARCSSGKVYEDGSCGVCSGDWPR